MKLKFIKSGSDLSIIFSKDAVEQIVSYRQVHGCKEAGGQLFGVLENNNVFITEATPPSKKDFRGFYRFKPCRKREQKEIQNRHSNGLHFFGDWHSHPQIIPSPSDTDINSIRDCFIKSKHNLKYFVLVIIGTEQLPQGIYVALVNERAVEILLPYLQ